ncbi:uncharacterized protein LOC134190287 [Corticium candelabrum]|uniref:uncharacterized protein LOC134190287 n=1 Tax=Corticium candelabrum TaxID=121492 RepID=UPI002E2608F6|nr:uncharacterized protein LOC134190287 [Corticium candelabrum]
MCTCASMSDFDKAKKLLIGAVDAVLSLADQAKQESLREPCSSSAIRRPSFATFGSGRSAETPTREEAISQGASASMEEHRRLFGYRPAKGKGKRSKNVRGARRRCSISTWKKDCICLCDKEQSLKPSSEEKIELAKMGLGLGEALFDGDGDAEHIHRVLLEKFPVLEACGGYTLLCLAENSHHMVEIEEPDSGMTVPFLKDVVNQAKLYIRPLQREITKENMKKYSIRKVILSACIKHE